MEEDSVSNLFVLGIMVVVLHIQCLDLQAKPLVLQQNGIPEGSLGHSYLQIKLEYTSR